MNSSKLGRATSGPEVVDISPHGIWLLVREQEHFLSFQEFPWFREAPVAAVLNVREDLPGSFHWPQLDVDLDLESILHVDRFPLKARHSGQSDK